MIKSPYHLIKTSTQNPTLRPPPLCGAMPAESNYIAKVGDKVAARVKGEEENWILAEVVSFQGGSYEVDDVDADEGNQ